LAANHEKAMGASRRWKEAHADQVREYSQQYGRRRYAENREAILEDQRRRYAEHPEVWAERARRSRAANPRVTALGERINVNEFPPEWREVALRVRETRALLRTKGANA
jgi:hypothetical protein